MPFLTLFLEGVVKCSGVVRKVLGVLELKQPLLSRDMILQVSSKKVCHSHYARVFFDWVQINVQTNNWLMFSCKCCLYIQTACIVVHICFLRAFGDYEWFLDVLGCHS